MAGEGAGNIIARRVTDDLIAFSGKTSPSNRAEVATSSDCLTQLTAVIAEFEAIENQDEVHDCCWAAKDAKTYSTWDSSWDPLKLWKNQDRGPDSLLAVKDAKRAEHAKLEALNEVIAEALDEIETQETNVKIFDGDGDGV
ncbi:hypothetical protein Tco_1330433 [Tanacetum coccineum]